MQRIDVSEFKRPLGELIDQCSGENGRERFEEFKLWLKGVFPKLLAFIITVSVSAHKRFVMKDHLKSANIGWTGDNFKRVMLDKIEENVPAGEINIHRLEKNSLDPEIMAEMGPEKRVTCLANFVEMIGKQSKGQEGPLLTDGSANVAYIVGTDGSISTASGLSEPFLSSSRTGGLLATGFSLASNLWNLVRRRRIGFLTLGPVRLDARAVCFLFLIL